MENKCIGAVNVFWESRDGRDGEFFRPMGVTVDSIPIIEQSLQMQIINNSVNCS